MQHGSEQERLKSELGEALKRAAELETKLSDEKKNFEERMK